MNVLKRIRTVTISIVLLIIFQHAVTADAQSGILNYEIYSEGKKIGKTTVTISSVVHDSLNVTQVESITEIKFRYMAFFTYSLYSEEVSLIGENGLIEYRCDVDINDEKFEVNGKLNENHFVFHLTEKGSTQVIAVSRDSYDISSIEGPESMLENVGEQKTIRVLNLENMDVVEQSYTWMGREIVSIGEMTGSCREIQFKGPEKQGTRLITDDDFRIIVEEKGSDSDGPYHVKLVSLKEK